MADDISVKFGVQLGDLKSGLDQVQSILQSAMSTVQRSINDTAAATNRLTETNRRMSKDISESNKHVADTFHGLQRAVTGVFTAFVAYGAARFAGSFVTVAAEVERLEIALTTVTGSSGKARAAMDWIKAFAAKTPFEINEVAQAFLRLEAQGLNARNSLGLLGDAAAAMGKPLMMAVDMFTDAVRGENERLKEFGINARVEGEKISYHWSQNGQDMVITTNKTASDITAALNTIFERFKGGMDAQSRGWSGMVSNMHDAWTTIQSDLTNSGPFDVMKQHINGLLQEINTLKREGQLGEWIKIMAGAVIDAFAAMTKAAQFFAQSVNNIRAVMIGVEQNQNEAIFNALKGQAESLKNRLQADSEGGFLNRFIYGTMDDASRDQMEAQLKDVTGQLQHYSGALAANASELERARDLNNALEESFKKLKDGISSARSGIESAKPVGGLPHPDDAVNENRQSGSPVSTADTSSKAYLRQLEEALKAKHAAFILEDESNKWSARQDVEFWRSKLSTAKEGSVAYIGIQEELAKAIERANKEEESGRKKGTSGAKAAAAENKRIAKTAYDEDMAALRLQLDGLRTGSEERITIIKQMARRAEQEYGKESRQHLDMLRQVQQAERDHNRELREIADERMSSREDHDQNMYEMQKSVISQRLALEQISEKEALRLEKQLLDERYRAELTDLHRRLELMKHDPSRNPVELEKIYSQMRALTDKYWRETQQVEHKAALTSTREWKRTFDSISRSVGSAIKGMITGAMTFKQALSSVFSSLLDIVLEMIMEMVAKWIWGHVIMRALSALFGAEEIAQKTTVAAESQAIASTANVMEAMSYAAVGAVAASASVAAIPFIGWAMAPGVMMQTYAMLTGMASMAALDTGAWDIPREGMAMLHQGEVVLPAHAAEAFRNMAGGKGMSRGGDTQINIYANDAKSFERQLARSDSALNKQIRKAFRDFKLRPSHA